MSTMRESFSVVPRLMLRSASLLLPSGQRDVWLREWRSELWYFSQAAPTEEKTFFPREREATVFCVGAFHDAWYLRCERRALVTRSVRPSRSALCTTTTLFVLAMFSFIAALLLPGVTATLGPSPYRDTRNLVLISSPGKLYQGAPQMRMRSVPPAAR